MGKSPQLIVLPCGHGQAMVSYGVEAYASKGIVSSAEWGASASVIKPVCVELVGFAYADSI
jgi:hypothetical protein